MNIKGRFLILIILFWVFTQPLSAQQIFDPPVIYPEFRATKAIGNIVLDGKLDEEDWLRADTLDGLFMKRPRQLVPATERTIVRVLFDDTYLYIAGEMFDSRMRDEGVTVIEMVRDFQFRESDLFGLAIDGLLDRRNAMVFQVNPYGAIRDLQAYDDRAFNRDWNALWYARTQRNEDGWTAEIAIPWESMRYNKGTDRLGVIFTRNVRRLLEENVWPAVPRNFNPYRMNYAADLVGLEPPDPDINVQLNPYALGSVNRLVAGSEADADGNTEIGGELKWAINSNSVLDLTVNTDFAQADIDEQVVNLARFNVLFPERRQFFLENADLFSVSGTDFIQPFFSRRIGLDEAGGAIPINAGARFVRRGANWNAGAMLMSQDGIGNVNGSEFGVLRYSRNFGPLNQVGIMSTLRQDRTIAGFDNRTNFSLTADGVVRLNQQVFIQGFYSFTEDSDAGFDMAGRTSFNIQTNQVQTGFNFNYVGSNYNPAMGFLGLDNFINLNPFASFDFRPDWLPKGWRRYQPSFQYELMLDARTRKMDQAFLNINPISFQLDSDTEFGFRISYEWQNLLRPFSPLGEPIASGDYLMHTYQLSWNRDPTKTISWSINAETGEYYDGRIFRINGELRYLFQPFLRLAVNYERNQIRDLGLNSQDVNTDLYSFSGRLALSPRFNVNAFFQRNAFIDRNNVNIRMSWEYQPLSFLFIVLNESVFQDPLQRIQIRDQVAIAKLTWMKQF